VAAQVLQEAGAPPGVAQAVSNAIEVAQLNDAPPAQVAEIAYQAAKDAGATEVQAVTAAEVAQEAALAQELQAETDNKGDMLSTPFDSRFGEWGAPTTMASTFGPDEAGMEFTGKGDRDAVPFDARFGEWGTPTASRDSFDSRFGEWQSPPVVADRDSVVDPDLSGMRGVDPNLARTAEVAPVRGNPMSRDWVNERATPIAESIGREATKGLTKDSTQEQATKAMVVAAHNMAKSGIPASVARGVLMEGALKGAAAAGYSPNMAFIGGKVQAALDDMVNTAMQGYHPVPGQVQGPPSQVAVATPDPGRPTSVADFGIPGSMAPSQVAATPSVDAPSQTMPAAPPVTSETNAPTANVPGGPPPVTSSPETQEVLSNPQSAGIVQDIAASYGVDIGTAALIYRLFFMGDVEDFAQQFRGLKDGGRPNPGEVVLVGEEGPELFVSDTPGTIVPYIPGPGRGDRTWPKAPTPDMPGKVSGYGRELQRRVQDAQNMFYPLMGMIETGAIRLNEKNWEKFLRAQAPSKNIEDRRNKDKD